MDGELWRRVTDLFDAALERPVAERRAFLEAACPDDAAVRAEASRLLAEFEKAGEFLEGSLFHARQALAPGQRISDRYRIEALLGRGGMGEVYKAHDELVDEAVALKTLRADRGGDEEFLKRFRQEVQLSRRVTHPSVCRIFDVGVHDEPGRPPLHFFTMQLLEGETLAARLAREGQLAPDVALPIARQIAEGLDAAHAVGITHGDLKSANVMFHGGRAVITDFGLARLTATDGGGLPLQSTVASGLRLAGTIAYMSPEQLEGQPPTSASDVYSFGVLLFEMVVGKVPFNDSHLLRSVMQRVASEAPDVRSMAPALGGPWSGVIAHCLRRDPAGRYASATAVVRHLESGRRLPMAHWTRRQWLIGAGVTAAAGAVALIPLGLRLYGNHPVLPEGAEIVLGTIANLTSDDHFDAATELFRNQLGQSARVNLVEPARILAVLQQMGVANDGAIEPAALREAAWRANAALTVFGTIARVGPDFVLNVQVETRGSQPDRPRDRLLKSFSAADPRALMSSVRDATVWVRTVAGETATTIAAADVLPEDATTQSWKALSHYAKGQQLFLAQQFNPAIDKFAEALAEDPKFTLAALRRSDLLVSQNRQVEGFSSYRKALALLNERPVTRPEELYGRGMYALDSGDYETADRHFRTWAMEYPYDWRAPFYRMMPLCMNGHPEEALELLQGLTKTVPDYGDLYVQIVRVMVMAGRTGQARALLPTVRKLNRPERADLNEAYISLREGDCVACLDVLREVQKSSYRRGAADAMMQEGLLLIDAGYPAAAAKNIEAFLRAGSWVDARPQQIALQVIQAWAEMLTGRHAAAVDDAQRAVMNEAAPIILTLAGTIFARCGAPELARQALRATQGFEDVPVFRIAQHRIAGELARAAGQPDAALAELRQAAALEPAVAHRQYLIEALPAGSEERLELSRQALRFPWQNFRPPLMYHIGAVGLAAADVRAAGIEDPFASRFLESAKRLDSKL